MAAISSTTETKRSIATVTGESSSAGTMDTKEDKPVRESRKRFSVKEIEKEGVESLPQGDFKLTARDGSFAILNGKLSLISDYIKTVYDLDNEIKEVHLPGVENKHQLDFFVAHATLLNGEEYAIDNDGKGVTKLVRSSNPDDVENVEGEQKLIGDYYDKHGKLGLFALGNVMNFLGSPCSLAIAMLKCSSIIHGLDVDNIRKFLNPEDPYVPPRYGATVASSEVDIKVAPTVAGA